MRTLRRFLVASCAWFGFLVAASAGNPVVFMTASQERPEVGETVVVETRVKNAPDVYGVELGMSFDPEVLEVVNVKSNGSAANAKVIPGAFFQEKSLFYAANQAENRKGTITYAATLLNPAPSSRGSGTLIQTMFRAKKAGAVGVRLDAAKFGTREGVVVVPGIVTPSLAFTIVPQGLRQMPTRNWNVWVWSGGAVLIVLLFAGMASFRGRTDKNSLFRR